MVLGRQVVEIKDYFPLLFRGTEDTRSLQLLGKLSILGVHVAQGNLTLNLVRLRRVEDLAYNTLDDSRRLSFSRGLRLADFSLFYTVFNPHLLVLAFINELTRVQVSAGGQVRDVFRVRTVFRLKGDNPRVEVSLNLRNIFILRPLTQLHDD